MHVRIVLLFNVNNIYWTIMNRANRLEAKMKLSKEVILMDVRHITSNSFTCGTFNSFTFNYQKG